MGTLIREKHHRLAPECYIGHQIVAFSMRVKKSKSIFTFNDIVEYFSDALLDEAHKQQCNIHVYLFMPDHLHLIVEGISDESNILEMVNGFKQRTGFWLYQHRPDFHWQKDYYDHIIRNSDDLRKQIEYILNNPVRKGIIVDWKQFPHKGSTVTILMNGNRTYPGVAATFMVAILIWYADIPPACPPSFLAGGG